MKASKRRNYLKRTLAFISALSIIGSFSQTIGVFTSLAVETTTDTSTIAGESSNINTSTSTEPTTTEPTTTEPTTHDSSDLTAVNYSRIKVDISNQYDFENAVNCEVQIYKYTGDRKGELIKSSDIKLKGKNASEIIETEHLETGEYLIEVRAKGFQTFEQVVEVKDTTMVYTVKVTLGFQRDYVYAPVPDTDENGEIKYNENGGMIFKQGYTGEHPGVLKLGDVNGDGKLDSRDSELLLEAIDYSIRNNGDINISLKDNEVLTSDLNHDGKTSLADLTLFTRNYFDTFGWNTKAHTTSEISAEYLTHIAENVKTETSENIEIKQEVSFAELLNNSGNSKEEKKLELAPTGDKEIGIDNPIEVAWPITDGVEMKTLNLDTTAEVGEIIIETYDGGTASEDFSKKPEQTPIDETSIGDIELSRDGIDILSNLDEEEHSDNAIVIPFGYGLADSESEATAKSDENGISVDLGEKIAIKKITIKITKAKNTKLVEIAKVEILNGLEQKMEEPPIAYPVNVEVKQVYAQDIYASIEATWGMEESSGVTGYEFEVSTSSATKPDGSFVSLIPGITQSNTKGVDSRKFKLESEHGNFKLIKTNTTYYVHVRAINDSDYKSAWSDSAKVTTKSHSRPDKPDYVKVTGGFRSLSVSWGGDKTNSTQAYDVYYKRVGNNTPLECIENVKGQSCSITSYNGGELEDKTEYEVYVVAKNTYYDQNGKLQDGVSNPSDTYRGETTIDVMPKMPKYNAINIDENGNASANIASVTRNNNAEISVHGNSKDVDNDNTAWAVVDGDGATYYRRDAKTDNNGVTVTFDGAYEIGSIGITSLFDKTNFNSNTVQIWYDEDNKEKTLTINNIKTTEKTDDNKKKYRIMELPATMKDKKIKKIRVSFNSTGTGPIAISELCFYAPDKLKEEILGLFTDELQLDIKDSVTQEDIDYFRYTVQYAADPISGETYTEKTYLLTVLDTIEDILQNKDSCKVVTIHSGITTADHNDAKNRNFSGLNALQPLGAVAGKDTEIIVYVACREKNGNVKREKMYGIPSELFLVHTQYNSESNSMVTKRQRLEYGENRITLNQGSSLGKDESGGSLYIEYCGARVSQDSNFVRVSGVNLIPMLDIYGVTDINERYQRATEYIKKLDAYVGNIEKLHNEHHKGAKKPNGQSNTNLDLDYKKETCILGATEILDDRMMYSLPAAQILAGLGTGSAEARAVKLIASMDAMEEMVDFFYQHKGLSLGNKNVNTNASDINHIPDQHLNIRYQRMFAGAAMYAAGNHIGIQWGSASGMVNCKGVKTDENGKYISGGYFGWGIAHEIGHCLNDGNYADPEITNNYFALLAQAQDKNAGSRLNYNNVFAKVTSGTKGKANQATQLGLYWQLHLAYDKDYNYKTYGTEQEIFDNLFYARMDTYSRSPQKAPGNLTLSNASSDQKLMRLACAAANKDILEFFERWGKTPDANTIAYASQFGKEKRAIMYANEDSRVYAMTHESQLVDENDNAVAAIDKVEVTVGTGSNANKVTLKMQVSNKINAESILGYEIIRCTISNGDVMKTPIAFSKEPTFTDTVTSYNNRTVSYEVTLIDHHLNRSEMFATEMIKVHHDGSLDKKNWSISSNNLTAPNLEDENSISCKHVEISSSVWTIDDDFNTVYTPTVNGNKAEIIMDFNQSLVVTGLKYTAGDTANSIGNYTIFVKNNETDSDDEWIEVAKGTFNGSGTAYFSNSAAKYISTYDTTAVKLQIDNQDNKTLSIAELDVLGVTGDNVDFLKTGESVEAAFGFLTEDYKYGDKDSNYIPAGSLVFTGSYKGHPLYNVVLLYDEEGYLVGRRDYTDEEKSDEDKDISQTIAEMEDEAEAHQTILADIPNGEMITNVSQGTWIYWIEPEDVEKMVWPEKVRVELYRVNNAETNDGQRIVSDSLFETLKSKDKIGEITLGGGKTSNSKKTTETASETDNAE